MTASSVQDLVEIGNRFVSALTHQAWEELAECLDDAVQFRALVPGGLRTAGDRQSAADYFRKWFGGADQLMLLSSVVQPMHDRLHLAYRLRAHTDQWYIVEQQAYCMAQEQCIEQIDVLCSGFRPESESNQARS